MTEQSFGTMLPFTNYLIFFNFSLSTANCFYHMIKHGSLNHGAQGMN